MRSVKLFRQRNAIANATAFVAICAWLLASNHCALGLMPATEECHSHSDDARHCAGHAAPSKDKHEDNDPQCCTTLQVAFFAQAKNPVGHDSRLFTIQAFLVAVFSFPDSFALRLSPLGIDTGPPRAISFAESVLQRSVLAHAPPSVV